MISSPRIQSASPAKVQAFYAVVLHDFVAERADELDAKSGDSISVVAQSNREWFVAKPIGRLGRPGLIPVAFVEIRDPTTGKVITDVNALIDSGALPRVEEWKRAMMSYKANSISLGVLDEPPAVAQTSNYTPPAQQPYQHQQPQDGLVSPPEALPEGILLSADVKSFHFEMDEYWFRVHAIFQPYSQDALPPAKQLVLFRSYNDFYDFQVGLLNAFPHEAGRHEEERILPYMPGPAPHVDNEVTVSRRAELDDYLHKLSALQRHARYILEHILVRQFLALKPGDAEVDVEPRTQEIDALQFNGALADQRGTLDTDMARKKLSQIQISDRREPASDGSDYEDEADMMGRGYDGEAYNYQSNEHDTNGINSRPNHKRVDSAMSHNTRSSTSHTSYQRAHSPLASRLSANTDYSSTSRSSHPSPLEIDPYYASGYSRASVASSQEPSSSSSMRSSHATSMSSSGRVRSQASSTLALSSPPISATIPQTAFIKIKIFDRASDDLVAIRVHPRVTHEQLMDKVHSRLGQNVNHLQYRDSMHNEMVGLENDDELRYWLDNTERHVLYAK